MPLINTSAGAFAGVASGSNNNFQAEDNMSSQRKFPPEVSLIRRWARRVADTDEGGQGTFDATLAIDNAAGLIVTSVFRKLAHAAIRDSANAVIFAVHHNGLHFNY